MACRACSAQRLMIRRRMVALLLGLVTWGLGTAGSSAWGQEAWQYAPYRTRVWVAMDHSPQWGERRWSELQQSLRQQLRTIAGVTWQVQVERAPTSLRPWLVTSADELTFEQAEEADGTITAGDKLVVVVLRDRADAYELAVRELDVRTRVWSHTERRELRQLELLSLTLAQAIRATFAPVARIEDVRGNNASVRMRAAGLSVAEDCPSSARLGDVMQVVMRRNDRFGNPQPGGIRVVDWTLLQVAQVEGARLECDVHSISRGALGGRSSSRVERFALGVRRPSQRTVIQLVSSSDPPRPLVGYEIYAKDPQTETTELVGETDWRGFLEVPREEVGLKVFYVRSGGMLLARLPLVPGQSDVARAELVDDEKRLQAEALVRGVQAMLIDVVARRELLAARIRQKIGDADLEEAQELVDQFRSVPTLADLRNRLDRAKQEVATSNPRVQARIDQMFAETQAQLSKFIRPNFVEELTAELSAARSN